MRKLIIVDLYNHSETKISNADILFLNQGKLTYKNCEIIDFNINKKKIFKRKFLTKINNFFDKQKNYLQKKLKNINSIELDIFNLRNDKTKYLEKLCTIMFSKKIAQKYKHVELVIDNEDYLNIYNQVYNRKFKKILLLKKNNLKKININYFFFKFILKSLYFIFLSKILSKNKFISNKKIYLSFYPYLFNKNKDISIYGKKNIEYLNFSLTDESHLNLPPAEYLKHIKEINKIKNLISIEKYIDFFDFVTVIRKFYKDYFELKKYIIKSKFYFEKIDISSFIIPHIKMSFLNRSKLFIYENALKKIKNFQKLEEFHYILFEYSFGFFVNNLIKKNIYNKNFQLIGYQHGIFSKKLMWLNLLVTEKDKKKYLPNKIICNQRESLKAYLKFSKNLIFKRKKIDLKNKLPKVSLKSKNILVYPGQHDIFECFNFFTNDKRYINNKIYFKLHPNNKKKIKSNFRNIKIVKNIDYKKKYNIYLSPTTTLVNQFNEKKIKYNLIKFNYKFDLL